MTALEEWNTLATDDVVQTRKMADVMRDELLAELKVLKNALARAKGSGLMLQGALEVEREQHEDAEAELAALKARRCEECAHAHNYDGTNFCTYSDFVAPADFACNRWTARE